MSTKSKPELRQIPVDKLQRGRFQPRRQFDPDSINELAKSIQSAGLIQPIVIRPVQDDRYEIVAGERRWRAAQLAGLDVIPCLINFYTDEQTAAVTTIENINRVDLNPIEEADAYQRLIDEFQYLHEEIAAVVGKSRVKITNSLRLLKLEPIVKQLLIEGRLSEGHGKVLAGLTSKLQIELARKCLSQGWSVRKIELEAKKTQENNSDLAFKDKDPDLERLEMSLSEHVGCKVSIDFADSKGQLKIDFHNIDILEGILHKLGYQNN